MTQATDYRRPKAICALFGISRSTLYRWIEQAAITPKKRGNMTFIKVYEVGAYIESAEG